MTHKPRAEWGNQYQFILTSISYAVGLGNIWRFPALVYEQKGGAFLIPYFICSFVVGFPILYMELSLGQFAKAGPAVCYGRIRPILQGLGWAMVMLSLLVSIYYNMIVAWSLIYIFMVVTGQSWKWSSCENDFNTIYCSSGLEDARCTNEMSSVVGHSVQAFYFNGTCHLSSDISARRAQAGLFAMRGAVVQSGTGLAFVAYPEALARMPWSGLWSFLFFVMIWILGVSTQFGYGEVLVTALSDQFPFVARHKFPTAIVGCFTLFCCGLVMCTRSGIYFFNIFNDYSSSFSLEIVLCLEALLLCHIYGYSNYKLDLEEMFGKAKTKLGKVFGPTGIWISIVWKYLAPLLAIVIFIFSLLTQIQTDLTYGKGARLYRLPRWCIGFGWCISVLPLTFLPIFAVYNFYKFKKRNLPIAELFKVQPKWPSANRHREADGVERTSL
uniref:Sodium-and chloride-dependent GABA transporter 2 n=1 Tax=Bursaphelenchus xylophilus TaxID=6326 RepID=A0A1I7S128_BURXY